MLESVLRQAGMRTGLYTSPHLERLNERMVVNGAQIADADLAVLLRDVEAQARGEGTFFEFTTALAFEHFRRSKVQIAVLETGMGGRLDATNVVDPLVAVITSIGLDHTAYLGETIEKIAAEKAGIIKPDRAVIVGDLPAEALDIIRRKSNRVIVAKDVVSVTCKSRSLSGQRIKIETDNAHYGPLTLPLAGAHQFGNCAVAVAALEHVRGEFRLPISDEAVARGLERVRWPARFQCISADPPIVVDGAHNPQAAAALARTLDDLGEGRPLGLVFGFLSDKDASGFLAHFSGRAKKCWAVAVKSSRAMPLDQMVGSARSAGLDTTASRLEDALRETEEWARGCKGMVCVTGSLYLAGEALRLFEARGRYET
jgi:dihydrofolate synthase/folylpolyglutamate synthase